MAKAQSQYSIAFNEHPVHENLKQLKQQIADLPDELLEAAREHDASVLLPRLEPALEFVGALLASADTALITPQMLDELNEAVQQISSALTPFKDNTDLEQLPTIQSGVEALLNRSLRMAPAIGVWAKTDARKAAAQLGEASSEKTRQLQQQASDLQGQLNQLKEQADQASDSMKTTAEERVKELEGQLDTLKTEAEAERARVQQTIDSFETQFKSEQEVRDTRFEEIKQELATKAEETIEVFKTSGNEAQSEAKTEADTAVANLEHKSKEVMDFLSEKKQEAIDMVDTAATSTTAGAFKTEAEEQKEQADRWRRNAIIGGAVAVLVALAAVVLAVGEWAGGAALIVAKITAVTLLLGIAGYAAGQSGQHRRREHRARRLYMQMVAFKPFSEPLPETEKNTVRKEFIERMFVGDPAEDHKGDDAKLSDENLSVLLKFIDAVRSSSS
jgi:chemotaxis protein histidine kinase CheA